MRLHLIGLQDVYWHHRCPTGGLVSTFGRRVPQFIIMSEVRASSGIEGRAHTARSRRVSVKVVVNFVLCLAVIRTTSGCFGLVLFLQRQKLLRLVTFSLLARMRTLGIIALVV